MENVQGRSTVNKAKEKISKIKEGLAYHIVDSTALLAPTHPIFSAMEVGVYGMSDKVSIDSRLLVTGLTYAGLGSAFTKGRDLSRRLFKITGKTRETIQNFHDSAYTFVFNSIAMPPIYLSMGASVKEAVIGGLAAGALGIATGPIMGYSADVARDLIGLKECNRTSYPNVIKRQKPFVKKGLARLLVVSSLVAMAGIYALTNNNQEISSYNSQGIEQVVSE